MFEIPKGLATKVGLASAALLAVVAALQPFLDGAHDGDAKFWAALATVLTTATVIGRMLQSAAALLGTHPFDARAAPWAPHVGDEFVEVDRPGQDPPDVPDEPGDHFYGTPHLKTIDPSQVPPDEGDIGEGGGGLTT